MNNLIQKMPFLGHTLAINAPRVPIYRDPLTRDQIEAEVVLIQKKETKKQLGNGLEVQSWEVWFPKLDAFGDRDILAVSEDFPGHLDVARNWVRHRFERWNNYWVMQHSSRIANDPYGAKAVLKIEKEYLEKLKKAIDIQLELLKDF